MTLFDSLDTMWIMGLKEEFKDAVESIKDRHFGASNVGRHPVSFLFNCS